MRRLVLIGLFLLSGCNLFSDNPLSDPTQEAVDSSIIGTWFWNDDADTGYVHIGTDEGGKTLLVTMVEFKKDGRVETTEFKGHSTTLASHRFLNLKWTKPQEETAKGYFFIEYKIAADTFEGAFLDTKTFEKAIAAGTLKGEVLNPGGIIATVLIHASQDDLRKYVSQNVKSLVRDSFKLKKVQLSAPLPKTDPAKIAPGDCH
jgi:hypothetical protein